MSRAQRQQLFVSLMAAFVILAVGVWWVAGSDDGDGDGQQLSTAESAPPPLAGSSSLQTSTTLTTSTSALQLTTTSSTTTSLVTTTASSTTTSAPKVSSTPTSVATTVSTAAPPTTATPTTVAPSTTTEQPATTQAPTTAKPSTTEPAAPDTGPQCDVIAFEAESIPLTGSWRVGNDGRASGGKFITWEGLSREKNNNKPADVISAAIKVSKPGEYRFVWSMRQPDDVAGDKANDSWLNFPDADRFGPTTGGSYGGFVKIFGNSKGNFDYKSKQDTNHNFTDVAIVFNQPGTYTMQVAGRSHGHQIDRVVIYHESVKRGDAIAGRGRNC